MVKCASLSRFFLVQHTPQLSMFGMKDFKQVSVMVVRTQGRRDQIQRDKVDLSGGTGTRRRRMETTMIPQRHGCAFQWSEEGVEICQSNFSASKTRNEPLRRKSPAPFREPGRFILAEREGFEPSMGF